MRLSRQDVLAFRFHRHGLDAERSDDTALLDYGVQDTGTDGSLWALEVRGVASPPDLVYAWTLRGAPHAYRRKDVEAIARATAPFSEDDAAKRIFDASKPLRDKGIGVLDALKQVAAELREVAAKPVVKGDASSELTRRLPAPFLRDCRPCNATHIYEQPFRLAALQAGLELEPGTSPPVLRRIPKVRPNNYNQLADAADPAFDVVRNYLRFYGPAVPKEAAAFIDAPVKEVEQRWPEDVIEVSVDGEKRALLDDDSEAVKSKPSASGVVRLLAAFDPYLQGRDRELLVPGEAHRKDLWRTLGRPGAIVVDGDIAGTWRPRASAKKVSVAIEPWRKLSKLESAALEGEAERLAAFRGVTLAGIS